MPTIKGMLSKISVGALLLSFAKKVHNADGPGMAKLLHPEFPDLTKFVHNMVDSAPLHRLGGKPRFKIERITPHEVDGVHGAVAVVYSSQAKVPSIVTRNTIEVRIKNGQLLLADFVTTEVMEQF